MVSAGFIIAAPSIPNFDFVLRQIDNNTHLNGDTTAKVIATQQKEGEGAKVYEYIYYRRSTNDSFLIVMTAPESEKGNGYLKQGDNIWMYRRNTRTFQHINQDENISGSSTKVEAFEKKVTELYKPIVDKAGKDKIAEAKIGDIAAYRFEVEAKSEDITYPKRVYWVRQNNNYRLALWTGCHLQLTLMSIRVGFQEKALPHEIFWRPALNNRLGESIRSIYA